MKRLKLMPYCQRKQRSDSGADLRAARTTSSRGSATPADSACCQASARLLAAQQQMDTDASRIPPLSPQEIHDLIGSGRLSQFQLRRQADRHLLVLGLCLLALAASILRHTAPAGATPLNAAILLLSVAVLFVTLRAARSLWLMRLTLRHRSQPYRMACYADRLGRLSHRRRRWLNRVLRSNEAGASSSRFEMLFPRIPSYALATLLFLLIAVNACETFASSRAYINVTTNTEQTASAVCDSVNNIIKQL